jgi:SEC-C motif domain protein
MSIHEDNQKIILMLIPPPCPCGSKAHYTDCCEPYLIGKAAAPTAEALMRSRYTAYSQGNVDYLIATLHPKSRHKSDRSSLIQSIQSIRWVGLTIVTTQQGQVKDQRGVVEFVALYQPMQIQDLQNIGANQLHERSRFIQEKGQWFYIDGDILPAIKGLNRS